MDRGDTTQGLGKPGENVDSYFHPLPSSLSPVQTWQSIETEGKFASSTRKRQSHLANPGSTELPPPGSFKRYDKGPLPLSGVTFTGNKSMFVLDPGYYQYSYPNGGFLNSD